jgi:hypothetical protein
MLPLYARIFKMIIFGDENGWLRCAPKRMKSVITICL